MTLRHFFTTLKPQINDYVSSWINYSKVIWREYTVLDEYNCITTHLQLFGFLVSATSTPIILTPQWAHDIVQEFVYQYQSFCQYRCQVF